MQSSTIEVEQVRVRILPDGRMGRKDAATYLGVAEKTMAMWAVVGKGPSAVRVGGRVFYFKEALDNYVQG